MSLSNTLESRLGRRYTAAEVAAEFDKSKNWAYRNAEALGGVKMGKEWVFFENNMVACLKNRGNDNANTAKEQEDREAGVVRTDHFAHREAQGTEMQEQEGSLGLGSFDPAEADRVLQESDTYNLLT